METEVLTQCSQGLHNDTEPHQGFQYPTHITYSNLLFYWETAYCLCRYEKVELFKIKTSADNFIQII